MPLPTSPHPVRVLSLLILAGGGLLAGCGEPPTPAAPPSPAAPTVVIPSPVPLPTLPPPSPPAAGEGFPEDRPTACDGEPEAGEILDLLREEGLLEPDQQATISDGPLCAGTWQYAVITVPDLDPLQVVTEGEPGELALVTAGTDVCSVEVRVQAPAGIRVAAACGG